MRPGPATRAASFRGVSRLAIRRQGAAGSTLPVRQRSQAAPHLPVRLGRSGSKNQFAATQRCANGPTAPRADCRGGRNATGQPVSRSRAFQFAPAIHPRELPAATSTTANRRSTSFKAHHVFAEPTVRQNVASRNRKTIRTCAEAVDVATWLWKAEEKTAEDLSLNDVERMKVPARQLSFRTVLSFCVRDKRKSGAHRFAPWPNEQFRRQCQRAESIARDLR